MNPLFGTLLFWPLEQSLNALLGGDDYIRKQLAPFAGKCIEIHCRKPALSFLIQFEQDRIRLLPHSAETLAIKADASITGSPSELLTLLISEPGDRPLANPALTIAGDAGLLQDLMRCLGSLDVDWRDLLTPVLGDIVTEQAGRWQREASEFTEDTGKRLRRNLTDYLTEESRLLPHRSEADAFAEQLQELRLGLDRLEARTALLATRLQEVSD